MDALTCGGDLYEQDRFTPDTAEFLRCTFAELHPLPVFLAPGNHDWFGSSSLYHQMTWTPNVHVFHEATLIPVPLADGITLWGAGHQAPANTRGFFEDGFQVDRGGVHVALAEHLTRGRDTCPLLLDDVTVHADAARTRDVLDLLLRLSTERQIVVFTQEEQVAAWARERLTGPEHAMVNLSPVAVG